MRRCLLAAAGIALLANALSLAMLSTTQAGDLPGYTTENFIQALTPKTRGLRIGADAETPPKDMAQKDMLIQFEFGSADLTDQAKQVLDSLGKALQSDDLVKYHFELVGHTDIVGSDEYNLRLSESRAQACKEYLMTKFGISPDRLLATGVGKSDLAVPDHPTAAENRRVVIKNLDS